MSNFSLNQASNTPQGGENPNHDRLWPVMAGCAAVIVSVTLVLLKSWVWFSSGSSAVLSSVVDSLIDILISVSNLGAIWYASRPADDEHRHGHGKAEGVAALFQSAFIYGSSIFVFLQALKVMTQDEALSHHGLAINVMAIAIVLNIMLVLFQNFVKKKTGSLAVEADQAHYTGDILIHGGVILSLWADSQWDIKWSDPVFAIIVCVWLAYNAYGIGQKALGMLLDKELGAEAREKVVAIIKTHDGLMGAHDLRMSRSGRQIKMALDIEVDPSLNMKVAHDIAMGLERKILEIFPGSEIMIHIDPYGDPHDSRHKSEEEMRVIE